MSAIRRGPRWPLLLWLAIIGLLLGPTLRTVSGETVGAPPALLLANVYHEVELHEYWVSEKLDGVRADWDGEHLISRGGKVLNAPDWFTADFPGIALDGELWMGRGTFEALSTAVRRHEPIPEEWRKIRYIVFDLLKLKPYQDAEARVVAHLPGNGRFQGMLGSLRVELPDGRRFRLGTGFNEAERRNPPPLGTLITYRYLGLTGNGLPRFASYMRVRE